MNVPARTTAPVDPESGVSEATLKAAATWVHQLGRTLKTCRLYDRANPAVVRFRDDLALSLSRLLAEHGEIRLRFEADDVLLEGHSLHPARSRDDNLAFAFFRDGVRALTFRPGVTELELASILDAVLRVTGQNLDDDDDDLVTLLWEANLSHVEIDWVPAQGDVGSGGTAVESGEGALLPWPSAFGGPESADASLAAGSLDAEAESRATADETPSPAPLEGGNLGDHRSEDWMVGDLTVEVEAAFVELDTIAEREVDRFIAEYHAEHRVTHVTTALAVATACLRAGANDDDRREMGLFVPRVLRAAISAGSWLEAREALLMLREFPTGSWAEETFAQELLQPISVGRNVEKLDTQDGRGVAEFILLARTVGDAGIDWMTLAMSESQQKLVRQMLAEAVADAVRHNPERLAPWLSDQRWYVVRNLVHVLGWIGGAPVAGLLQIAQKHEDPRVRESVVHALQRVEIRAARPLLIRALEGADTRLFCQVLHQLSAGRDPATARFVFGFTQQEKFDERPAEERRAVYAAIASISGDEMVPELDAEMNRGNWFERAQEIHRHAIARCLSRIGTPSAIAALKRAAESKRAPVRQAAEAALANLRSKTADE